MDLVISGCRSTFHMITFQIQYYILMVFVLFTILKLLFIKFFFINISFKVYGYVSNYFIISIRIQITGIQKSVDCIINKIFHRKHYSESHRTSDLGRTSEVIQSTSLVSLKQLWGSQKAGGRTQGHHSEIRCGLSLATAASYSQKRY